MSMSIQPSQGTSASQSMGNISSQILGIEKTLLQILLDLTKSSAAQGQQGQQSPSSSGDSVSSGSGSSLSPQQQMEKEFEKIIMMLMQLLTELSQGGDGSSSGGQQGGGQQAGGGQQSGGVQQGGGQQGGGVQQGGGQQAGGGQQSGGVQQGGQTDQQAQGIGNGTSGASGTPSNASTSSGAGSATATLDASTTGSSTVGKGTGELTPVPLNGGPNKQAPTTDGDIDKIINKIDPSILKDPSQKGVGVLKGLPYGKMFEDAGKATGIDPKLLYADAQVETGDNKDGRVLTPNNVNPIQTAPGVWATSSNAAENLFMGAEVMKSYINQAHGNLEQGLNAYNTGDLSPSDHGFADGFSSYYAGVMSAYSHVTQAVADPSIVGPGQGTNVSIQSQI